MTITLIGSGNVAHHIGLALFDAGHHISQVYSKTADHAAELAAKLKSKACHSIEAIEVGSDVYLFLVSDDALSFLGSTCDFPGSICIHTSGSVPLQVFKDHSSGSAVMYPLQTFSRQDKVDISQVSFFLEADSESASSIVGKLARDLSSKIYNADSEVRKRLHLAAVFASNFSNHMYTISSEILKAQNLPFAILEPLVKSTIEKAFKMEPIQAQTGPAIRKDENIMQDHLLMLKNEPLLASIYELISRSIQNTI